MADKKENVAYRIRKFRINKEHELYEYCDNLTLLTNNLHNAVRFRQRQILTAVKKEPSKITDNEAEVLNEFRQAIEILNARPAPKPTKRNPNPKKIFYQMPNEKNFFLSAPFLMAELSAVKNSDYYAKGIPAQTSQQTIKQCVRDMKSFFAAIKDYKENPSRYTGKPKLPGYHKKGGHTMAILTNQDVRLTESLHGYEAKLPLTKLRMQVGALPTNLTLKEVRILPNNGSYLMTFIFTFPLEEKQVQKPKRIAAIDLGVRNLMSVTNNCRLPCLLYRGGIVKSVNQHYNKKIATIMSNQTTGSKEKFISTNEYYKVTIKRNEQILDFMHKVAKHLILWCVENRIDTLVVGENKYWKQEVSLGCHENQKFVQIPFDTLKGILAYLAEEQGIRFVRTEESYTSKASFVDNDPIPVYNEEEPKHDSFSGVRGPKSYKGNVRKQGFHGLYQTKDGTIINSDLNGSANILRKAYPHAFEHSTVDFNNVQIIIHPDYEKQQQLQVRQKEGYVVSHAKKKRLNRKQVA